MSLLDPLAEWWKARRRPLREQIAVEFDSETVSLRVLRDLDPELNQDFRWANIRRICFVDGGMMSSDIVHVLLDGRERSVVVPTEAAGGHEFFGALCDRGLLPEAVWRQAVGDTSGGTHCWPPYAE